MLTKTILLLVVALFLSVNNISNAQNSSIGMLKGIVVDHKDARVLYTKIVVANKRFHKELTVNEEGEFISELPVGEYFITAQSQGFYKYRRLVKILSGNQTDIKIKLKVIPTGKIKCPRGKLCL